MSSDIYNHSLYKKILFRGNVFYKNIILNRESNSNNNDSDKKVLIGERLTLEMKNFAGYKKIQRLPIESFYYPTVKISKLSSSSVNIFFENFLDNTDGEIFKKINYKKLKYYLSQKLENTIFALNKIEKNLLRYDSNSIEVYGNQLSNKLVRTLCQAANRLQIPTYGFTHGNYVGSLSALSVQIMFFGVVMNFICPTKGSHFLFEKGARKYKTYSKKPVNLIVSDKNHYFNSIFNKYKKYKNNLDIKSIMFVEVGYSDTAQYWPFYLDLTIKAAKSLRKLPGIELLIKLRPERLVESEGIYNSYFDKLLTEPFEEVFEKSDAYMFFEFTTTTFPVAILSTKPIISFSHSLNIHWDEYQQFIKRRCNIIDTNINSKNAIEYDEDDLLNSVVNIKKYDHKYIHDMYLS